MSDILTVTESTEYEQQEAIIHHGFKTFVEVGSALMAIRDKRLYRQDFGTFEDYCQERWGIGRGPANYLIAGSMAAGNLVSMETKPTNERQVRPLAKLSPDIQREVWQEAVDTAPNGKVTGAHVAMVVQARTAPHVSHNSGNNEWYTPLEYIEKARRVMGSIDLDPASSDEANDIVQATQYYTVDDDGLLQTWHGRVWLNPPYAAPAIGHFADKLADEYSAGNVQEAIVLVNNATETEWFNTVIRQATAIVFPRSRVKFWQPSGAVGAPLQGQAFIYLGNNARGFLGEYGVLGWGAIL